MFQYFHFLMICTHKYHPYLELSLTTIVLFFVMFPPLAFLFDQKVEISVEKSVLFLPSLLLFF